MRYYNIEERTAEGRKKDQEEPQKAQGAQTVRKDAEPQERAQDATWRKLGGVFIIRKDQAQNSGSLPY